MLAYLLALVVGLGSFALYMAAFFFPEVHRKYDLIWSGIAMFYALVLWVCAGRITGGVLLGQIASVTLLGWFGWQTLKLRRLQTPIDLQTQLPPTARTPVEVARETLAQIQESFRQSAGKTSFPETAERLMRQAIEVALRLRDWFTAMITTMSTPLSSPAPTAPTSPAAPGDSPSPEPPLPPEPAMPTASAATVLPDAPAVPTPAPTPAPADRSAAVQSETQSDVKVEWSDLEIEHHPELDTIDGADGSFPFKTPPLTAGMPPTEARPLKSSQAEPGNIEPDLDPDLYEH